MVEIPHIIKYMGSKRNIIDFVVEAIELVKTPENLRLYDLFGGSGVVSAAFRNIMPVTCNDIQSYTQVLAGTYLNNYNWDQFDENELSQILLRARNRINAFKKRNPELIFNYTDDISFSTMVKIEKNQRNISDSNLIQTNNLFVKNFSGTYWSFEQCLWIDALSYV